MAKLAYPDGPRDAMAGLSFARRLRRDPLAFIGGLESYGELIYYRMGPLRIYVPNDPRLIHETLVSKHKSFCRPKLLTKPLAQIDGQGLVISAGELWQRQRRLLTPAFSSRRFEPYARITVEYTQRMLDRWPAHGTLDVADEMTQLALEVIARILFDVETGDDTRRLGEAVRAISQSFVKEAGNPIHLPDWLPLASKRRKRAAIRTLDTMIRQIIRQRRASGEDRGDLLSMLLMAVDHEGDGQGMSDEQARDEAVTMFNAGHDSTAAGLAWVWYALAQNPAAMDKLTDEVDAVLGGRPATFADYPQLVYAQMVVKETLRLYPPTWVLFPREAVVPVELGGYTIAPKSWVYAFPYLTHRTARIFADPLRFDPERFAAGRAGSIPQGAYFPFGGGPRICIGQQLATIEMVLIMVSVVQRFRLSLAADQGPLDAEPLIAMRPKGGLRMTLSRRSDRVPA